MIITSLILDLPGDAEGVDFYQEFADRLKDLLTISGILDSSESNSNFLLSELLPLVAAQLEVFEFQVRRDTLQRSILLESPEVLLTSDKRDALAILLTGTQRSGNVDLAN